MKCKIIIFQVLFLSWISSLDAQPFARFTNQTLILDNGVVKREIKYDPETRRLYSASFTLHRTGLEKLIQNTDFDFNMNKNEIAPGGSECQNHEKNFLAGEIEEFYVKIDGEPYTSWGGWELIDMDPIVGENNGAGAAITLERKKPAIRVRITYLLYPGSPMIRKKISFTNLGNSTLELESLDVERLRYAGDFTNCWVINDYARQKSLGQFIGNWYDPVVVVHHVSAARGIVLGNEAPGVMKRTTAFLQPSLLTTGLTHSDQVFAFRKWLKHGEPWESPWAFSGLYISPEDPNTILNGAVSDYVRKYMGTRLSKIPQKPVFVYNTWEPFRLNINEELIYELVDAAAECGMEEFVIDDGWQTSYGDWEIDKKKFPNGLKPVFDYIKSKGMKPGLWISLTAAASVSNVFRQHPEYLVRKANGTPINLQSDEDKTYEWETYSMCMTTGWYDYIKGIILNLINEHGLEYLKGDFAVVSGAYTTDKTRSGCHAKDHAHKDREESMLAMYQRTWDLFDELHQEAPNLFIDCTFETMGAFQLIDLDMCKHAEGNWLSNFLEPSPLGAFRVRQMSWWRTPVIPATALVIGNLRIDEPDFELSFMSLIGSLPIMLGDPRVLNSSQKSRIKSWAVWLRQMERKYGIMSFRQDIPGFGEPEEGRWDGFQRINTDSRLGGLIGVFRNNAKEEHRFVTVQHIDPGATYDVSRAPGGEKVIRAKGEELMEKGFMVHFNKPYDGAIFEITKIE